jgi:lipid-A-disaccharide synthase
MSQKPTHHVMLLAGEASGDAHGAEVVEAMKQLNPDVHFSGMGSNELKRSGVDVFFDSASIAVVGIVEVLKHWGEIKQAMELVKNKLETTRPDLLVLIDYPEFNLKMARHAKSLGIKVLFYISPQVWAWRPKRIHKIGQSIDHMAVLFKFETEYYQRANIPVTFVGHPLVDKVKTSPHVAQQRESINVEKDQKLIGLFPGSRKSEINRLLPLMLETAARMQQQDNSLAFVMPVAASLDYASIKAQCEQSGVDIRLTQENIYDVIASCDAIVSCSGTVTLEIALLGVPLCIVYKMSWLSYQIMSRLITIPHIGLANIVANKHIVKELLQQDANSENISAELFQLLNDTAYRQQVITGLQEVKANLGMGEGSKNMAELILHILDNDSEKIIKKPE